MKTSYRIDNQHLIYLFLALGILLSLTQFLYARSLWIDEAMLALNLIERNYAELLQPLSRDQMAPILFLWIEKFFINLLGENEYGLRIFPLLCFWASLFLFYKFVRHIARDPKVVLAAFAFFSVSYLMIYHASEAKQYISDVLVTLLLFYLTVKDYKKETYRVIIMIMAGVFAIFLSNISVIILSTCGLYLSLSSAGFWSSIKRNLHIYLIWVAAFGFNYFRFLDDHPSKDYMHNYWVDHFMPLNPFSSAFWVFFYQHIKMIFFDLLSYYQIWPLLLILFLTGIFALFKTERFRLMILLFFPVVVHLLLSGLELYPFYTRLILYQLPLYIIVVAFGISFLYQNIKLLKRTKLTLVAPALVMAIPFVITFPIRIEEIKDSLSFVEQHYKNGDKLYVWWRSEPSLSFYRETGVTDLSGDLYFKRYEQVDSAAINEDRIFLVFSHIYVQPETGYSEDKPVIKELSESWKLEKKKHSKHASAYLFTRVSE